MRGPATGELLPERPREPGHHMAKRHVEPASCAHTQPVQATSEDGRPHMVLASCVHYSPPVTFGAVTSHVGQAENQAEAGPRA